MTKPVLTPTQTTPSATFLVRAIAAAKAEGFARYAAALEALYQKHFARFPSRPGAAKLEKNGTEALQ
jgi:hypothetical protein